MLKKEALGKVEVWTRHLNAGVFKCVPQDEGPSQRAIIAENYGANSPDMVYLFTNSITLSGVGMVVENLGSTISDSFCIVAAALAVAGTFVTTSFAFAILPASRSIAVEMEEIANITDCWTSSNALKNIMECLSNIV